MEREGNGWKPNRVKMDLTGEEDGAVSLLLGSCPIPIFDHKQIVLGHGSNPTLDKLDAESKDDPMQLETPVLATGNREVTS